MFLSIKLFIIRFIRHLKDLRQGKTKVALMRSSAWPALEKEILSESSGCAVCGRTDACQVHHIFPFHYCVLLGRADLELDKRNLTVLCESDKKTKTDDHHLLIGHLDDFESANESVLQDEITFHDLTAEDIKKNPVWIAKKLHRLTPWDKMSLEDKQGLLALINKTSPKNS